MLDYKGTFFAPRCTLSIAASPTDAPGANPMIAAQLLGRSVAGTVANSTVCVGGGYAEGSPAHVAFIVLCSIAVSLSGACICLFTISYSSMQSFLCTMLVDAEVHHEEIAVLHGFPQKLATAQAGGRLCFNFSLLAFMGAALIYIIAKTTRGEVGMLAVTCCVIPLGVWAWSPLPCTYAA